MSIYDYDAQDCYFCTVGSVVMTDDKIVKDCIHTDIGDYVHFEYRVRVFECDHCGDLYEQVDEIGE